MVDTFLHEHTVTVHTINHPALQYPEYTPSHLWPQENTIHTNGNKSLSVMWLTRPSSAILDGK